MNVSPNDYVVAFHDGESKPGQKQKFTLIKVASVNRDGELTGRIEHFPHIKAVHCTIPVKSVAVNLGPNPPPGKVFGCDTTQLYRKSIDHPAFGTVHFMCKPSKEDLAKLSRAMNSIHAKLKKFKLLFLLEEGTVFEFVNHAFSKYAGMFYNSKDREKAPSRIALCVDSRALLHNGIDSYEYVLAHELGHALHFHHLKSVPTIDSMWVKAYTNSVQPKRVDKKTAVEFLAMVKRERSVSGAAGQMAEEDQEAVKLIVKWIHQTGGLRSKDLDLLLATDKDELVDKVWPTWDLVLRELKPKLTLYSTKNYQELFAECFAFWLTGQDLPVKLKALMDRSVLVAQGK